MHGNVYEWVQDHFHHSYRGAPADGRPWEDATGGRRVLRGGSWLDSGIYLRSAYRGRGDPGGRGDGAGFRLVRGPQPSPEKASR